MDRLFVSVCLKFPRMGGTSSDTKPRPSQQTIQPTPPALRPAICNKFGEIFGKWLGLQFNPHSSYINDSRMMRVILMTKNYQKLL